MSCLSSEFPKMPNTRLTVSHPSSANGRINMLQASANHEQASQGTTVSFSSPLMAKEAVTHRHYIAMDKFVPPTLGLVYHCVTI